MSETKGEIQARINELDKLLNLIREKHGTIASPRVHYDVMDYINKRKEKLLNEVKDATDNIFTSVLKSHKALCAVKNMGEKDAYGQDPALYYGLAICGESGEMGNKIVKAFRNGNNHDAVREAVTSELPDIYIYGAVLAYVFDLDLDKLVSEKADIVTQRALDGYYGGPLKKT